MKKKFMITAAIAALTLVGAYLGKVATDRTYGLSELELANADALADTELNPPCNNTTGYRKWDTSSLTHAPKEQFRDCCYQEKKGYNPTGCTE